MTSCELIQIIDEADDCRCGLFLWYPRGSLKVLQGQLPSKYIFHDEYLLFQSVASKSRRSVGLSTSWHDKEVQKRVGWAPKEKTVGTQTDRNLTGPSRSIKSQCVLLEDTDLFAGVMCWSHSRRIMKSKPKRKTSIIIPHSARGFP
jgi:hypothetical protein